MADNKLSLISKIMTAGLALLGFASCDSDSNGDGGEAPEYGAPSAAFRVTGRVVDKETSDPVEGIRAVMVRRQNGVLNKYESDTLYTSADGIFDLKVYSWPGPSEFLLEIKDVDGETNGNYATKETDIVFENPAFTDGSGSWYEGQVTEEVGDIVIEQVAPEK